MSDLGELLKKNREWAKAIEGRDPFFFERLARQQKPKLLWIGCSDSRVPANQITGLDPGEVFVHRNVANIVVHTDLNCLSVVQFAIEALGVTDIIVCGHYGCGGVSAAMEDKELGLIDNWIRNIRDVYRQNLKELEEIENMECRANRLAELNVIRQVINLDNVRKRASPQGNIHKWTSC